MANCPNPYHVHPELFAPLIDFGKQAQSWLEPSLVELVKLRASQINGCAPCITLHSREARAKGESEDRIYLLNAWRESELYTPRERAALAWTEALTRIAQGHPNETVDEMVDEQFTYEERIKLAMMIVAINSFNRLNIGFRLPDTVVRNVKAA
ncbi:carboxymuconolactone decarboxylase family protein [Pelagibacterium xiamenense]|uniref:carboxymuconolactone decarboxylase family protein n=1 Tax=Pelagibacterium xiamenense TaxID=2901140 RepID=UPI001E399F8C|nr:carboxymuconolactone decarboxylase family protein [Pelagibacterium xiamenense]MCD7061318.1 carboxymuconolactone decarboxylase family protein [Pelagibacterium xiamenense]